MQIQIFVNVTSPQASAMLLYLLAEMIPTENNLSWAGGRVFDAHFHGLLK